MTVYIKKLIPKSLFQKVSLYEKVYTEVYKNFLE